VYQKQRGLSSVAYYRKILNGSFGYYKKAMNRDFG
jgi:hypothetical protein